MKMRSRVMTLAAMLFSLVNVASLDAKVFDSTYSYTPNQDYDLITKMLLGPGVAWHPSGKTIDQTAPCQIGIFSNLVADAISTFTNGVILSTGDAADGPSLSNRVSNCSWKGDGIHVEKDPCTDQDINNYFGTTTKLYDPAALVLYIQPKNTTINIPFVLASEHFYFGQSKTNEPAQIIYQNSSDKFAIFMQELGSAAEGVLDNDDLMTDNIAKFPDGGNIGIATVNQHTNSEYFISNIHADQSGSMIFPAEDINLPMEFNGAIAGLVAVKKNLSTNKIYKLKIIVADYGGNSKNTVLFLRDRGITSGADLKIAVTGPAYFDNPPGEATFTNTVSNIGPAPADGVVVTNYLPFGAAFVGCEPDATAFVTNNLGVTNAVVWAIGDRFAPGSNAVMKVSCKLKASGVHTNIAHVVTSTGDYDESNNTGMCKTVVGSVKLPLTIRAIITNKVYGTAMSLENLAFVASITDETNGTYTATGIDVAFTNLETQAEADPKSADATAGRYGIYLSNVAGINEDSFAGITYEPGELEIKKAQLTISVSNAEWRIGTDRPAYGIEDFSAKLKPGDAQEEVIDRSKIEFTNAVWTASKEPKTDDDAKTYTNEIWLTRECLVGDKAGNYAVSIDPGDLTILKQLPKLTITAINTNKFANKEMVLPALDFILEIDGTNGTETVTGIDVTFTNVQDNAEAWPTNANAAAGEYTIHLSNIQGTGLAREKFREIVYNPGTLKVKDPEPLYVRAISTNKVYGSVLTLDDLQYVASAMDRTNGLHAVTGITVLFTNSVGAPVVNPGIATADVDTYGIVLSDVQVEGLSDFSEVIYEPGVFAVTPKPIKIVPANDLTKPYGQKNYRLHGTEYVITDAAGEEIDVPDITDVELVSDGTAVSAPCLDSGYAGYDVKVKNYAVADENNYSITCETGKLYVTQFPITITANDVTNVYGEATTFRGFRVDPDELPNNELISTVTLTNEMPITTGKGTYPGMIVPSHEVTVAGGNASTNNYSFSFVPGELTVIPRDITIHAKDQKKTYGDGPTTYGGDPEKDFEVLNGTLPSWDTITSVHIDCDEAKSAATPADTYVGALVPGHDVLGNIDTNNYNIAFTKGTLIVEQLPITVTPVNTNKVYGSTLVFTGNRNEFEFDHTKLKNGDSITNVVLTSDGTNRTAKVKVDNYDILAKNADGKGVKNYLITYGTGTLEVVKFPMGITVVNTNKVYGEVLEFKGTENEFAVTPTDGLPNDEKVTNVTFVCSDSTNRLSAAGPHDIIIDQLSVKGYSTTGLTTFDTNNYEIAFTNGILTVDKAPLTITANDATNCYGEASSFAGTEFAVQPGQLKNGELVTSVHLTNVIPATTNVGTYARAIVPSHPVTVAGGNASSDNYEITFVDGTLTITQACLTVTVEDSTWKVGKEHPEYGFKSFVTQLKAGDQEVDVTGGSVTFTNARWQVVGPTKEDIREVPYSNEVWIVLESFNGPRATNYWITVIPGAVTVIHAEPRLETTVSSKVNRTTGLRDLELTIVNVGDGEVVPGYDYWVQLKPGPAETGRVNGVELFYEHTYYLANPTGTMSNGYDYVDLTPLVTNALATKYAGDVVFETNRSVTVTGVGIYHWKRWDPNDYITNISSNFLVTGRLYNPADADHNFVVTEEEKKSDEAKALLGSDVAEYIEMTRLALLPFYYWDVQEEKWVCPQN